MIGHKDYYNDNATLNNSVQQNQEQEYSFSEDWLVLSLIIVCGLAAGYTTAYLVGFRPKK